MQLIEPQLLITDDDRDFRETLGEVLRRKGFGTLLAQDGAEALRILRSHAVHILVLDMHMPRLTGLETIARVRQDSAKLPCILMSAKLDDQIVEQAHRFPTVEVMAKPFSVKTLTETIRQALVATYGWNL